MEFDVWGSISFLVVLLSAHCCLVNGDLLCNLAGGSGGLLNVDPQSEVRGLAWQMRRRV